MSYRYKIELQMADGTYRKIGEDFDKQCAIDRAKFTGDYIEGFAQDLQKVGWTGPGVVSFCQVRDAETGEVVTQ